METITPRKSQQKLWEGSKKWKRLIGWYSPSISRFAVSIALCIRRFWSDPPTTIPNTMCSLVEISSVDLISFSLSKFSFSPARILSSHSRVRSTDFLFLFFPVEMGSYRNKQTKQKKQKKVQNKLIDFF